MGDIFIQWGPPRCLFAEWQMEQLIDTVWEVGVPAPSGPRYTMTAEPQGLVEHGRVTGPLIGKDLAH